MIMTPAQRNAQYDRIWQYAKIHAAREAAGVAGNADLAKLLDAEIVRLTEENRHRCERNRLRRENRRRPY